MLETFKGIKTFVFDVDGVLTDGALFVFDSGEQVRRMNIKDGYALQLAIKKGYKIIVCSGSSSNAVTLRLQRLGITEIYMNIRDKRSHVSALLEKSGISWDEVLFMGDDIPDYQLMKSAAMPCCPSDAVPEIRQAARYISNFPGGHGCVRDVIEKVLKLNGDWELDVEIPSK